MVVSPDASWLARLWFGFSEQVTPRRYFASGAALMGLKYGADAAFLKALTGLGWPITSYLSPLLENRGPMLQRVPQWAIAAWVIWSMPFAWIGLSMSFRRAKDAGITPFAGLLFLVPFANYLMMAVLCLLPTRAPFTVTSERALRSREKAEHRLRSALSGAAAGVAFGLAMLWFAVYVLSDYGAALFLGTPIAMGVVSGYVQNRAGLERIRATMGVAALSAVIAGGTALLFALEGGVCVAMALPPALVGTTVGALAGRALAGQRGAALTTASLLAAMPVASGLEHRWSQPATYAVTSSVEVNAPIEAVWSRVVSFPPLAPPTEWMFRAGVSYPVGARIEGRGSGAIRYCDFSTGSFVEPITAWEEPTRLAFDVTAQPIPMQEWSPYRNIHPPHLDGYFRSTRGEFRLTRLGGGRTKLEGSTWYSLALAPAPYWSLWADFVVHVIHQRVLEHVKAEAERG